MRAPAPSRGATATATWQLQCDAFRDGAPIPKEYTCDGPDRSPPLAWDAPPNGTRSLALIMHDPDAPSGDFTHWVLFNLPADVHRLDADIARVGELPDGARQGRNDFGRLGYGGPCPPPGRAHHYVFDLYALDTRLNLPAGASRAEVEAAMQGHILSRSRLGSTYARQR